MTDEEIRMRWLGGMTCASKRNDVREVFFSSPTHIVLKHRAHAEYTDRCSKVQTCIAHADLYERKALVAAIKSGHTAAYRLKPLKTWEGRVGRSKIASDCIALGVTFHVGGQIPLKGQE